jgi:hypothetical protein
MSVPSVGKEEPNFNKHSTIRHEFFFLGKEEPNITKHSTIRHEGSLFGSYLPTVGTLMSYCTVVCEVRFFVTYRRNVHVLLYCFVKFGVGKEEPNFTKHSAIRHECSFCR